MKHDEETWKTKLTPEQYKVMRQKATEAPFSGKYLNHSKEGMYTCAACGSELFPSSGKFKAPPPNEGWPSFSELADSSAVTLHDDDSFLMRRTEVKCANCGSHLGHLFADGPPESGGKHYCINSVCLDFKPSKT